MDHPPLSPEDIVSYRFKQSLRGYSVEEVDALLDRLADQVEQHQGELAHLRERMGAAEEIAASIKETEATLQRTLVVAQQAAERTLADAATQAEERLSEATAESERLRREAEEEATRVRADALEESGRVRSEASEEAARARSEAFEEARVTVADAQDHARREVEAARGHVEDASIRHAEVLASIAEHRDALRAHLGALDDLAAAAPVSRTELVVDELPTRPEPVTGHGDPTTDDAGEGHGDDVGADAPTGDDHLGSDAPEAGRGVDADDTDTDTDDADGLPFVDHYLAEVDGDRVATDREPDGDDTTAGGRSDEPIYAGDHIAAGPGPLTVTVHEDRTDRPFTEHHEDDSDHDRS